MVSLVNRRENNMWNIILILKGENIMKKTTAILMTIILAIFLSFSTAIAEGRKHKNDKGCMTEDYSCNHRYTYNKYDNNRNHKYTYNKNYNNRNHRYNTHNKRHDRGNHRYRHNQCNKRNHRYTHHKRNKHQTYKYNRHNNRHEKRSNGYVALRLLLPGLILPF